MIFFLQDLAYSFHYEVFHKAEIATANISHVLITVTTQSKPKHHIVYTCYSLLSVAQHFKLNREQRNCSEVFAFIIITLVFQKGFDEICKCGPAKILCYLLQIYIYS